MNILVTGGAGFIGSHVADAYLAAGHHVVVVDDLSTGRESNVPAGAVFERLDIRDDRLRELFTRHQIQIVSHQAARADVRESVRDPRLYLDVNVAGGLNLLECCKDSGVREFIFASSGGCAYGEPAYIPTDEAHPLSPEDPYGASKVCFEMYLQTYSRLYGLRYVVLRYPNIYGPRQNPFGEAGVTAMFAAKMLKGDDVVIYGGGSQVRDFLHVADVASANVLAVGRCDGQTFNLGHATGVSVKQVFERLKRLTGYQRDALYQAPRLGENQRSVLSFERIHAEWGWRPEIGLDDGLASLVDYIRARELADRAP